MIHLMIYSHIEIHSNSSLLPNTRLSLISVQHDKNTRTGNTGKTSLYRIIVQVQLFGTLEYY